MCLYQTNDRQHLRDGNDRPGAFCMRNTWLRCSIDRFCLCVSLCRSLLDLPRSRKNQRTISHGQRCQTRLFCKWLFFLMAFDPISRWLHGSVTPGLLIQSSYNLYHVLMPMILLSEVFLFVFAHWCLLCSLHLWQWTVSLAWTLIIRNPVWVQHGTDRCEELLDCVSTNCGEFPRYGCTMIGPDGHLHRCGAAENSVKGLGKSTRRPIAQSSDLLTSNFMPCHCLGTLGPYPHPMKQLKEKSHALQSAAGPYWLPTCGIRVRSR